MLRTISGKTDVTTLVNICVQVSSQDMSAVISGLQGASAYYMNPHKFATKMKKLTDNALLNIRHKF